MNVDQINVDIKVPGTEKEIWKEIFDHQAKLADQYEHIELGNEVGSALVHGRPFNIDDHKWQAYLKDLMWRATEEIAEAQEAYGIYLLATSVDDEGVEEELKRRHYLEEMIDSLHFVVEACLNCYLLPTHFLDLRDGKNDKFEYLKQTLPHIKSVIDPRFQVVFYLGLAGNCLKNKPWKKDQKPTDWIRFIYFLLSALDSICVTLRADGLEDEDIYALYMKKNAVNQFRIDTGY